MTEESKVSRSPEEMDTVDDQKASNRMELSKMEEPHPRPCSDLEAVFSPTRKAPMQEPRNALLKAETAIRRAPLVFDSPRIRYSDAILFPATVNRSRRLMNRNAMAPSWHLQYPQIQSCHGPPSHVLCLGARRCLTLETLWAGMPRLAALRITELHLTFADAAQDWEAWWMLLADLFVNVRHLYVKRAPVATSKKEIAANLHVMREEQMEMDDDEDEPFRGLDDERDGAFFGEHSQHCYYHTSQAERLTVLKRLRTLVSLNGNAYTTDDYQALGLARPVAFVPLVPAARAPTPFSLPITTHSLLDQENVLADEDEEDQGDELEDDDDDLDLEIEAIREILEATKSLEDDDFMADKRPQTPPDELEEKKEDDIATRTPRHGPSNKVEIEYVSPETNIVACEWGAVACGSLSIPTYFHKANVTENNPSARLRFRPRFDKGARTSTSVFYAAAKEAMEARRSREMSLPDDTQARVPVGMCMESPGVDAMRSTPLARQPCTGSNTRTGDQDALNAMQFCIDSSTVNNPQHPLALSPRDTICDLNQEFERTAAHASLTSPFPMQFRARAKQAILAAKKKPQHELSQSFQLTLQQKQEPHAAVEIGSQEFQSPSNPDDALRNPIPLAKSSPLSIDTLVSGPDTISMESTKQGPKHSSSRPPPCPRRPRPAAVATVKRKLKKRYGTKWREKVAARSSSIMDDSDDDDSDKDNEDEHSSDEEDTTNGWLSEALCD